MMGPVWNPPFNEEKVIPYNPLKDPGKGSQLQQDV